MLPVKLTLGGAMVARLAGALAFAANLILLAGAVCAQPNHVGLLSVGNASFYASELVAYRDGLRALGYEEGRNLTITARYANGDYARLPALAAELVRAKIDLFFAPTEPALLAAKAAGTIPIVTVSCDPLDRLLGSVRRPGGNATGFTCVSSDLVSKRFGFLKELIPDLARAAILYRAADTDEAELKSAEQAAAALGVALAGFAVDSPDGFAASFDKMRAQRVQAVQIFTSALTNFNRQRLADLALEHRIAATFSFREFAEVGGLFTYGASLADGWRRAAYFTDKILKGTPPADLPVEQPTRFYLVINQKTASVLGLRIPEALRLQADQIIE